MRKIAFISFLIGFVGILFSHSSCSAGWFSKEKEIKDEYLEKLFTPVFSYESVKVMEGSKEIRFIVIKTKEKISNKMLNEYNDLLLSRGVNIYGTFHYGYFSWQKTVTDFAITITRKVESEPDTIEISESIVKDQIKKEPVVAASAKGKEIRIAIEKDFGKKWKKIKLIPDKEPDAQEPKIVRYPESKLIAVQKWPSGSKSWTYVSKDSFKEISLYFEAKLKKVYKNVLSPLDISSQREKLENPELNAHPLKIFNNIKTISQRIDLRGYQSTPQKVYSTQVTIKRSSDPHLVNYIEIEITED